LALFLLVASSVALMSGGHTYSIDEEIMFQTTRSIVNRDPALIEVNENFKKSLYRQAPGDPDSYAGVYGIGQSVAGIPLYLVGEGLASFASNEDDRELIVRVSTFLTNSILTAAAAIVVVLLSRELGASFSGAYLLGFVFAFGTFAFPHGRTFFSEPGTSLLLAVSVLCAIRSRSRSPSLRWPFFAGVAAGGAVLFRVSSLLFLPIIFLYLISVRIQRRDRWSHAWPPIAVYGAGVAGMLVLSGGFNFWRYGSFFALGYSTGSATFANPVLSGLSDLYFSPGKSLFLYAPIAALGIFGFISLMSRSLRWEAVAIGAIIGAHSILIARLPFWHGDASWGPRYLAIVLPLVVAVAAPVTRLRIGRSAAVGLGVVGLLGPALLGTLVYFNVFLARVIGATGSVAASHQTASWNPLLGQVELVPEALRDLIGADRPGEARRPPYPANPVDDYGFYAIEPRLDAWWAWVGPTQGSALTYFLLVPIGAGFAGALTAFRNGSRSPISPGA